LSSGYPLLKSRASHVLGAQQVLVVPLLSSHKVPEVTHASVVVVEVVAVEVVVVLLVVVLVDAVVVVVVVVVASPLVQMLSTQYSPRLQNPRYSSGLQLPPSSIENSWQYLLGLLGA